ncbi:MAG: BPSL0067 family protein [Bacteroidetes bacterium]|nr:BPSL0067 family protein [Bacteroidota bacterium]
MSFTLKIQESTLEGNADFKNDKGNHECVVFVQRVSGAPATTMWKRGDKVMSLKNGDIPKGTAIATFGDDGHYPASERHAAIYVEHDEKKIIVYDQWRALGKVKKRPIHAKGGKIRNVNDADCFYIIL